MSPYNPRSNGQIEVLIRSLKQLILKCKPHEFEAAFAAWKNTARQGSPSSNTLFFNRALRLDLPVINNFQPMSNNTIDTSKDKLRPLKIGSKIWIQNPQGQWLWKGTIQEINEIGRTYIINLEDGRTICRTRKFLRICYI